MFLRNSLHKHEKLIPLAIDGASTIFSPPFLVCYTDVVSRGWYLLVSLLTLNEGTEFYANGTHSFPKSPTLSRITTKLLAFYQWWSSGPTASNVYQQTLLNFSLCSFCIFLAIKFRNDMVEITTTPLLTPTPQTRACTHTHTHTHTHKLAQGQWASLSVCVCVCVCVFVNFSVFP